MTIHNVQFFAQLYKWLRDNGMHMDELFQWYNDQFGWGPFNPPARSAEVGPGGLGRALADLLTEIMGMYPNDQVVAWFLEQIATNPDMSSFVSKMQEPSTEVNERGTAANFFR